MFKSDKGPNSTLDEQQILLATMRLAEERSAMLAAIVECTDDAIISKNLDGIITSWNPSAERIFGYTSAEMIGESIVKLIPPDRLQEEPQIISRLRSGQRVDHFETKRLTKKGTLLDVSLTISPVMDRAGNIIGVSKIARDITDKKLEEQRKNDFIAIVSHELKTPLTSIRSYVQLALSKAAERGDSFTENVLRRAEMQTHKMTTMIHDFLNLSRLEEGKMSINISTFTLNELMEEVLDESAILAPAYDIQYEPCINATITADREKIGQVLNNLVGNAIKYSPEGSKITIRCTLEDGSVVFSITDQGVGISKTDQARLFERFYRVNNDQHNHISGFGIGLYLVAEILKLHGTEIRVQSDLGKGSTFWFTLPLSSDPAYSA